MLTVQRIQDQSIEQMRLILAGTRDYEIIVQALKHRMQTDEELLRSIR